MSRHIARETALKMLFQMDVGGNDLDTALHTLSGSGLNEEYSGFSLCLVKGVLEQMAAIDETIKQKSQGWEIGRMSAADRNILRLATYELLWGKEIPANIVIDEAVELAKTYSSPEAPAFVNGVLDSIYKETQGELE